MTYVAWVLLSVAFIVLVLIVSDIVTYKYLKRSPETIDWVPRPGQEECFKLLKDFWHLSSDAEKTDSSEPGS